MTQRALCFWSVVPAQNEEDTISHVIENCLLAGSNKVLVVCNGSTDGTLDAVRDYRDERVLAYWEPQPLGLDVPRAIGAFFAHTQKADAIVFCDGDLRGNLARHLSSLFASILWEYDLSLTDCYKRGLPKGGMAGRVIEARLSLNKALGRSDLGASVMSHGPSCISKRFMNTLPCHVLAIPPLAQALAVKEGLNVEIGADLAHGLLGSRERHGDHPDRIADLIVGDCNLAVSVFKGRVEPKDAMKENAFIGSLGGARRWDLLEHHTLCIAKGELTKKDNMVTAAQSLPQ